MSVDNIIRLPIPEAMDKKDKAGVDEYRNGDEETPFIGDELEEMYEEFIDALNYNRRAAKKGWPFGEEFHRIITNLAETIREYKELDQ
jgi:hypothetical protein